MEITAYSILEHCRHELAAQLLADTYDLILRPRVRLELETLRGDYVLDELVALGLDLRAQGCSYLVAHDESPGGEEVVRADGVDKGLGFFEELMLAVFRTESCTYCLQFLED